MNKYKFNLTFEVEVEATNILAAKEAVKDLSTVHSTIYKSTTPPSGAKCGRWHTLVKTERKPFSFMIRYVTSKPKLP